MEFTHQTSTIRVLIREDGITEVRSRPEMDRTYTVTDMRENVQLLRKLGGSELRVLVFISNGKYTVEARRMLANEPDMPVKIAMVAKGPFQTLVGNFFLGLNKPKANIKLFTSEKSAVSWLKTI